MIVQSICPMTEYKIYVEMKQRSFDFIEESFECGLTVVGGRGLWVYEGEAEVEDSHVITIISDDITMRSQIEKFCDDYAEEFRQEQIIWTEQVVNMISREYRR